MSERKAMEVDELDTDEDDGKTVVKPKERREEELAIHPFAHCWVVGPSQPFIYFKQAPAAVLLRHEYDSDGRREFEFLTPPAPIILESRRCRTLEDGLLYLNHGNGAKLSLPDGATTCFVLESLEERWLRCLEKKADKGWVSNPERDGSFTPNDATCREVVMIRVYRFRTVAVSWSWLVLKAWLSAERGNPVYKFLNDPIYDFNTLNVILDFL
jgi:hypothetical protein